jgi:hypothetical protein
MDLEKQIQLLTERLARGEISESLYEKLRKEIESQFTRTAPEIVDSKVVLAGNYNVGKWSEITEHGELTVNPGANLVFDSKGKDGEE